MGLFIHIFIQNTLLSSCYVPGPVLGVGVGNHTPLPPSHELFEKHTYLSASFMAGCAGWKTMVTHSQRLPTTSCPTSRVQAHPSQVAVCRHSSANSQETRYLTPMEPQQGDTGHWWFYLKPGGSCISWNPASKLREPHPAIPCLRHLITY